VPAWAVWAIVGVVVVLVVAVVVAFASGDDSSPGSTNGGPGSSLASGSTGGAAAFGFASRRVVPLRVSKKVAVPNLDGPSRAIQDTLTNLYGQTLVDQANWSAGPPAAVWNAFAPEIRAKAEADRAAFTIGESGRLLSQLQVSSSSLTIRFLIDQSGRIAGAQAAVSIRGSGEVRGSGAVNVVVVGHLLMQQVNGAWLITGYPSASVSVKSPPGSTPLSPGPSPSGGTP
jgi:hypothetical protein